MSCLQTWPEPVVRVQSLAESGITRLPRRYIKSISERPRASAAVGDIPVVSLRELRSGNQAAVAAFGLACQEWGFFQLVDHDVSPELMKRARDIWREFFSQPAEVKQRYANSPATYEGYGSRLGVEKGAPLDWSDYFFLNFMPPELRRHENWPSLPSTCRALITEYGNEVVKLCGTLMKALSLNLGLQEDQLEKAFGGESNDIGACLRVNFYPKCPQPDLTLGLSPHSDPGGMTLLLPDEDVAGLQVRHNNTWTTVNPIPNAFVVNIGDQIQVLSNAIYKSVEHRVIVNSEKDRVSLAFFYNPKSDLLIEPMRQLVEKSRPALYDAMTYDEYRLFIRTRGPRGKAHVESRLSPR